MLNYHRWLHRLQVFEHKSRTSGFYLLSMMCVAFLLGISVYNIVLSYAPKQAPVVDKQKVALEDELRKVSRDLATLRLTLKIEQEANVAMRGIFNKQLDERQQLETELAFYRSLMVPDATVEGIGIHTLELSHGMLAQQYQLRLILTQLQKRKTLSKAQAEINLIGVKEGEAQTIALTDLTDNDLMFNFTYFQIADAEFTVPDGFNLQRIEVKVQVKSRQGVKGGQTVELFHVPELLQGEKELRVILEQNSQVIDNSDS
ncbi:DUF6776 family protein [Shewanella intestini]|uniref:Type IV pilus assembly protein PilO n=1 Tax=Shewanella intestini TaxID=2017544 RepID=A0ABS5HY37_9GAMM|nr:MULTISPECIES: DUF6776 family protein [Shewanella]MBR9726616.1 hypothetical protein [Shewanella intestini]MRG34818.1 hypothetical protein [Shewanella sp. XMDDZSB0408]